MENSSDPSKITGFKRVDSSTNFTESKKKGHDDDSKGHHHHHHSKSTLTKKFLLRIVHSNSYIAIPILAISLSTYLQLGSFHFNINYLGFLFFSTLLLYPLHRLIGIQLTIPVEYTKSQREVKNHPNLIYSAILLGAIGTLYFTSHLDLFTIQLLIPLALISLTYSIPIIPTINGWKRLRDIPGLKIFAISLVVTFTTSSIPLFLLNEISGTDILLMSIQRFLFILAITIPFDVRDVRMDEKWNLKTIPLLLGNTKAIRLAITLVNLMSAITIYQLVNTGSISTLTTLSVVISNFWATFILYKFRENNSPLFNAFMMEGTMVVQFALITIAAIVTTLF